jgi:hypothetical protein
MTSNLLDLVLSTVLESSFRVSWTSMSLGLVQCFEHGSPVSKKGWPLWLGVLNKTQALVREAMI